MVHVGEGNRLVVMVFAGDISCSRSDSLDTSISLTSGNEGVVRIRYIGCALFAIGWYILNFRIRLARHLVYVDVEI